VKVDQRYRYVYKPLVFVASLVPFLWILVRGFGLFDQGLGPDPVKETLHTLGKTGLNLLLITLLVTPVRQLTGFTHVLRIRRMLGLFAFFYILLHFLLYISYQGFDFGEIIKDVVKRPYITIGFLGLLLLIPLAITSTNKMMRRLGRRWQSLHRLIYVIAILGVWHYYWQVKKDIREPLIYAGILAVLLGYRAVRAWLKKRTQPVTSKSAPATAPERT
jgi:methionine sulfoxide reductase heme-binding subunit